jgi:hypothetical protein
MADGALLVSHQVDWEKFPTFSSANQDPCQLSSGKIVFKAEKSNENIEKYPKKHKIEI